MTRFRNVRVKMRGGKTRIQRAMVMASGKLRFVKNVHRGRTHSVRVSKTKTRSYRGGLRMARRRGFHRRGSLMQSVEKLGGVAALVAPYAEIALNPSERPAINWAVARLTGWSMDQHKFQWERFVEGWGPVTLFSLAMVGRRKLNGLIRRI